MLKGTWFVNQWKVHPLSKVMVSDVFNLHPYTEVARISGCRVDHLPEMMMVWRGGGFYTIHESSDAH